MTKKRTAIFVATIVLLSGLATQVHGQMRLNIFRLGLNLGISNAQFHLARRDNVVFRMVRRWQDNAQRALQGIIMEYGPPFNSDGLKNMLSRLESFDPRTSRTHVNNSQRANFYQKIRDGVKESLALTYGHETRNRFQKEPTCESVLLYIGYNFGQVWLYTLRGLENNRRRSLGNLTREINYGKQVIARLKCAMMDLSVFNRVNIAGARNDSDFGRIALELERVLFNFTPTQAPNRTSPSQRAAASRGLEGNWGRYIQSKRKWQADFLISRQGEKYIGKIIRNGRVWSDKEYRRSKRLTDFGPWCFRDENIYFVVSTTPAFEPSVNHEVFRGEHCEYATPWRTNRRYVKSTILLWLEGHDTLKMKWYSKANRRWSAVVTKHRIKSPEMY